ncbi:error-prone DNA polymerase [Methyloceanibacter sp.]|uniref:error-prone DNA polymerase n=1 Tax=Methyloceanibacter sp. TaxID=1965321 RepID=UPI002D1E2119|nr:error-prone DNA polymerase [Methyloceanibacter sp.]HML93585.1 error-prone DNA polymerase [Methyloceanibacter sp.]
MNSSMTALAPRYAELDVTTNFTFLRGGSHAEELVAAAKALGHAAIAVADENTLAGVVRAHSAAKENGIPFVVGTRLVLRDAPSLLAYPTSRAAYGSLCRLLTRGQRRAGKGDCVLVLDDVAEHADGMIFIALPSSSSPGLTGRSSNHRPLDHEDKPLLDARLRGHDSSLEAQLRRIKDALPPRTPLYLAARHSYRGDDRARIESLARIAGRTRVPLVATGAVLYHSPARRPLQDVLTCIREKCTLAGAGLRLEANAERHLKAPSEMARLFKGYEDALERTVEIAEACRFSLDELKYEYPDEPVPQGKTPQTHLEELTWEGAAWRFPSGIPEKVRDALEKELALIAGLDYAPYFLTVHDIVHYARSAGILCQGRGSAANSAVCYCLAITNVDPSEIDLLFERFISPERREPPDIDVDFEHERREEVIQYIYARYGRDRAGLAATVISYRGRSAVREVGKVFGLSEDTVAVLSGTIWGLSNKGLPEKYVREAGLDPSDPLLARCLALAHELIGFPRHLSQHVGGFVLTRGPLSELVPIGNAAMEDRTVIEWDKDDLDALGLLKVDVLGLGMLTCIRKAFALLKEHYGENVMLGTVPQDDPAVYDMLCRADSIGVFQVESRAQMNMLPRLKPRCFYDLVIQVAIVRPGPIQGDMVHPYLRRRSGAEKVEFPSPHPDHGPHDELHRVLDKTMGVPLFQEQAMRLAMVAAKFSGDEANELRRAMATFRRRGTIGTLKERMVGRMTARGYPADFAERCFNQIKGFGEYGFPESHAASFAHLVYVSSWLKCHYPDVFACALLNSQPMGFYAPAQIVRCAREHGVEARAPDVNHSHWDCTLEPSSVSLSSPGLTGRSSNPGNPGNEDQGLLDARLRGHDDAEPGETPRTSASSLPDLIRQSIRDSALYGPLLVDPRNKSGGDEQGGNGTQKARSAGAQTKYALRLGFRQIDGFSEADADQIAAKRSRPYAGVQNLWRRGGIGRAGIEKLASADAFRSLGLDRRQALWEVRGLPKEIPLPLFEHADATEAGREPDAALPAMPLPEHVVNDYRTLRLSLKAHPMTFLRARVTAARIVSCAQLKAMRDGARVSVGGVILVRQRPGSASGVVFMTIEDETGIANAVIWPTVLERMRKVVMGARLVVIHGRVQRHEDIIHVVAGRLEDKNHWLDSLSEDSLGEDSLGEDSLGEDGAALEAAIANADEERRPGSGSWRSSQSKPGLMPPVAAADHVKRPEGGDPSREGEDRHPRWHPRCHPRDARIIPKSRILPKSRDFH